LEPLEPFAAERLCDVPMRLPALAHAAPSPAPSRPASRSPRELLTPPPDAEAGPPLAPARDDGRAEDAAERPCALEVAGPGAGPNVAEKNGSNVTISNLLAGSGLPAPPPAPGGGRASAPAPSDADALAGLLALQAHGAGAAPAGEASRKRPWSGSSSSSSNNKQARVAGLGAGAAEHGACGPARPEVPLGSRGVTWDKAKRMWRVRASAPGGARAHVGYYAVLEEARGAHAAALARRRAPLRPPLPGGKAADKAAAARPTVLPAGSREGGSIQ
jgi:hypothetical protein